MTSRRNFLLTSGATLLSAGVVSRVGAASLPEAPIQEKPSTMPPLTPPN
ncbi:MAG TPA: copper oxidase, partial [Burkholderiaceae bacterium]|nr:copper oxidase [Burkholderiaceae bacterium]